MWATDAAVQLSAMAVQTPTYLFVPSGGGGSGTGRPARPRPQATRCQSTGDAVTIERIARALDAAAQKRRELLEARRAKMAERVLYAKAVAERQRQAADTVGGERRQALDEVLAQAAQKRAERLQRQVAYFAAAVQRAKQVCRRQREVDARKQELLRARIERQHAARSRSSPAAPPLRTRLSASQPVPTPPATPASKVPSRAVAAAMVQRWWRRRTLSPLRESYCGDGLRVADLRRASFDGAAQRLTDPAVLRATQRLLHGLARAAVGPHRPSRNPVRPFLSSYLMVCFPDDVLQQPPSPQDTVRPALCATKVRCNDGSQ